MFITIKKLINKLHLILGLASGIVLFTVAVTGCIYCFETEIRNQLYKDVLFVPQKGAQEKPLSELIQTVKQANPKAKIKSIRVRKNSIHSVEVSFKGKPSVYIDQYTGKILGSSNRDKDFLSVVLKIHRNLYLGETGEIITGVSVTIFLIMIISGIVLWWPANKALLAQKLSIKLKSPPKKRTYDLHSVLGFYASWFIIFTAITGMIWSFKWAENTMYWLSSSKKEQRKQLHSTIKENTLPITFDNVIARSGSLYKQSEDFSINFPEDSSGIYRMILRYDNGGFYRKQDQLSFDQYSGKLLKAQLHENLSKGDKLKSMNYNIHTGKILGITGQVIIFFASLITASLPITGFMVWRGKRKKKKKVKN